MNMEYEREFFETEYDKVNEKKDSISSDPNDWINCTESELNIGDTICVNYLPDSQKYLYTHTPELGIIKKIEIIEFKSFIDNKIKKEFSIIIHNHNDELVDINKGNHSIYSKGYCIYIQKFIK